VQGRSESQVDSSSSGLDAVDYEIAVHRSGTPALADAMVFAGDAWKSLAGVAAISVLYEPGSIAHGYSPNQLHAVRRKLAFSVHG
jgi:hypothetical protein